jgi:glycerol-3-phosphate O-acyltransferase / dihydroxyacetone phosphate acyltransferase
MWLHRHFHGLITFAARTYFRVTVAGEPVPSRGPVLLVANHPNSLMDPALVAMTGDRPVRFLARAPLFEQLTIGWLIRGTGAIPVYRRMDDPELVGRNEESFSAVHRALAGGAVVGIFPEGLSHSAPSLAPLKTGAARIAIGASRLLGSPVPILPVGITFRGGKERFRSDALVVVGPAIPWDDLFASHRSPLEAIRALTGRIHEGLSQVTVNVASWEDFALVEGAEAIHDAEFPRRAAPSAAVGARARLRAALAMRPRLRQAGDPTRWLARMQRTARALEEARTAPPEEWEPLARDVRRHMRVLRALRLEPADLHQVPRASVALRWTLENVLFFGLAFPLAVLGTIVFFLPHQVVSRTERRLALPSDRRATYRVLAGSAAFGGWILILAAGLREFLGWRPALWALGLLPLLGLLTLRIRGRWRETAADLRRIVLLRGRRDLRSRLLERQSELARRIRHLRDGIEAP